MSFVDLKIETFIDAIDDFESSIPIKTSIRVKMYLAMNSK